MKSVAMIGCGAIGAGVLEGLHGDADLRVGWVVLPARSHDRVRALLDRHAPAARLVDRLDLDGANGAPRPDLLVECAGHAAIEQHVLPALARSIPCTVASIGALGDAALAQRLEATARAGATQVHLVAGAIGAIDALAAARIGGLDSVVYTGRKPPRAWLGTPAEADCDLAALTSERLIYVGSAADAARLYPKNANVAATVALAGVGVERTQVRLYADPAATGNLHHIEARGAFGRLELTLAGRPLAANPKTSALTVYSVLRALRNQVRPLVI